MRSARFVLCVGAVALLAAPAWADITWNLDNGRGRTVRVHLPDAQARALKANVSALQAAGTKFYVNMWQTQPGAARATYPQTNGVSLVAAVDRANGAAWMERVGKKSIGFMCQGTPTEPHQTGEVRIGDLYFSYYSVNSGGTPTKMSNYFQSGYNTHCEATIPVSDAELKAFKAFYLARSNNAIFDSKGNCIQPEFTADGATKYGKSGWVEGCAAASSSALDRHWMEAFRGSIDKIRQVGQQKNIPEMANATADMADAMESLTCRLGLKQQCSPQGMVRRFTYANNERFGMITILNGGQSVPANARDLKWDYSYHDGNYEAWSGMRPVTVPPDLDPTAKNARTFQNVRINDRTQLNTLLNDIH